MNLQEAYTLKTNVAIYDSEGTKFIFVRLDAQNDLVVQCRAAINGTIVLDRAMCTLNSPNRLGSEYDCDHCHEYVPDGDGLYINCDDETDRVCTDCFNKHGLGEVDHG